MLEVEKFRPAMTSPYPHGLMAFGDSLVNVGAFRSLRGFCEDSYSNDGVEALDNVAVTALNFDGRAVVGSFFSYMDLKVAGSFTLVDTNCPCKFVSLHLESLPLSSGESVDACTVSEKFTV